MTFQTFEASVEGSRPVELFSIVLGAASYYYTSAEDIQTISGQPYTPLAITRGKIDLTREQRSNIVEVTVPSSEPFVRGFVTLIPGQRAALTISRLQRGDTPTPQVIVIFSGFVQSVAFVDNMKHARIAALPISSATSRSIPRFTCQAACNHDLGDARCKVAENAFKHVGTVTAVSGNTITVSGASGFVNGYFAAGRVEIAGALDRRLILGHTGSLITMLLPFGVSPLGSTVTLFAGCGHDPDTCFNKFNNTINYGGFKFVPVKDIFRSGIL